MSAPTPPVVPPPPPPAGSLQSIEHVIFAMQENRSFDHYFGKMPDYRRKNNIPGADDIDGLPANASNPSYDMNGNLDPSNPVFPYHLSTECHENLSSTWNESHKNWNFLNPGSDTPTLDGFVAVAARWSRNNPGPNVVDIQGKRAMGYYTEKDIPFYYALASQFAMSDRHFCSLLSHTLPNRLYMLGASSFGHFDSLSDNDDANLQTPVDAPTIFDLCRQNGISWKIYLNQKSDPHAYTFYASFTGYRKIGGKNSPNIVDSTEFMTDCQNGTLPQVAMLDPSVTFAVDEHPGENIQTGVAWLEPYYRALMSSPSWQKSAMFLTWDEHGALYDHVPPPSAIPPDDLQPNLGPGQVPGGFDRLGFRVPLIVVSPWVKKHYVSHAVTDHTSILKFIETRFNLPNLTRRDAAAHDMLDIFDFNTMAWPTPPDIPSQPTNGPCQPLKVGVPAP